MPTFEVFHAMVVGLVAQTGNCTVCGMLTGAGLATSWSHHRAHRFFSTARWSIDQIGLTLFDLVLTHLVANDADLHLAVDDTAHRRRGKKIHGVGWIHDGSAPARNKLAFGHRWVVVGVIVRPSFLSRPLCLPVLCRRWQGKGTTSTVELAAQMITTIAARVPHRRVHVVADAAYDAHPGVDRPRRPVLEGTAFQHVEAGHAGRQPAHPGPQVTVDPLDDQRADRGDQQPDELVDEEQPGNQAGGDGRLPCVCAPNRTATSRPTDNAWAAGITARIS